MADYLIKDIPEEKMREFKTACAYFDRTMRQTLLNMMDVTVLAHQAHAASLKRHQSHLKKKEE